jgi:ABC-type glycerol-3-phosphate transport system substrate-binding protein
MSQLPRLAALASAAALVMSSCGGTATSSPTSANVPAGQSVTIRFDSYNYGAPGIGGKGTQQLLDEFQSLYPNIKIQARNVASTEMLNSTVAQAAAGDPPDVAQLIFRDLEFAAHNLPVQAIDQIAPPAEYDAMVKHQLPQALKVGQLNGHLYGSPYTFSTPTLFYNADIFRAAEINSTVLLPAVSQAAQDKWELRTAGEPAFGDKPVIPVNSGSGLFVLARDPLKQYAAWEFLRFAASQRGNTIITSVIGYLPQRDDVVDDPSYLKPFLEKEPRMMPAIKQLSNLHATLSWPGKNASQALSVYLQAVQSVVYGGQDAQSTMDAAATRVDVLLKEGW